MKKTNMFSLGSLAAAFLLAAPAPGAPVAGTSLDIGPSGSNSLISDFWDPGSPPSTNSGAIGTGNQVADGNLAIGQANSIGYYQYYQNSLAVGSGNLIVANNSFVLGFGNETDVDNTVLIGTYNFGNPTGYLPEKNWLAVGDTNFVEASENSLISGYNNYVYHSPNSATMGQGLINTWPGATIVGRYNDDAAMEDLIFAVGSGSDSDNRSNAFEVYAGGWIFIPRQGDIPMGEFGNGD